MSKQRIRKKYVSLFHVGLSGVAMALLAAVPAHAATVDYSTTATFSCTGCVITNNGSGDAKVVYGTGANTAALEFVGAPSGTSVDSDASFVTAGFGYIQASSTGKGSAINGSFTLAIDQSSPNLSLLTGAFPTATLSGMVASNKSTSYASFGSSPNPEVTLGGPVTYELDTSKNFTTGAYGYTIVSPSTGNGRTSLQGNISATPEPTLLTLTGVGFFGLAMIASRRRRQTS
jgi:hypothetical protein